MAETSHTLPLAVLFYSRWCNMNSIRLWIFLGLAACGISAAITFRWMRYSQLPKQAWLPVLRRLYGKEQAHEMMIRTTKRVGTIHATSTLPQNRYLRRHLEMNIIPGLALYQVLVEHHQDDRVAALAAITPIFRAWTVQMYRLQMRVLGFFLRPFPVFRFIARQRMKEFPNEGWDFEQVENSARLVAFNCHSCFYLRMLSAYDTPELTASFCQIDDWMGEMLPPTIEFHRKYTLARGGAYCDFRYANTEKRA